MCCTLSMWAPQSTWAPDWVSRVCLVEWKTQSPFLVADQGVCTDCLNMYVSPYSSLLHLVSAFIWVPPLARFVFKTPPKMSQFCTLPWLHHHLPHAVCTPSISHVRLHRLNLTQGSFFTSAPHRKLTSQSYGSPASFSSLTSRHFSFECSPKKPTNPYPRRFSNTLERASVAPGHIQCSWWHQVLMHVQSVWKPASYLCFNAFNALLYSVLLISSSA